MNRAADTPGWQLHPRLAQDTHPIARLGLSDLQLMDDSNYPWLILVPRVENAVEWVDLDATQQAGLTQEIDQACRLLQAVFEPHKLNIATLGNMVAQLHVHVIARFTHDIAWPRPVWGVAAAQPYVSEERVVRIARLRAART